METLLWTIPGMALALLFVYALSPVMVRMLPKVRGLVQLYATPQVIDIVLDWRMFVFLMVTGLLALLLSGAGAAWRTFRIDLNEDLKRSQESGGRSLGNSLLVAIQVGLCVILAAGAVLMLRTFWNLEHLNPGFDRAHLIEFDLNPQAAGYSVAQAMQFLREIRVQVASLPGVRSAASSVNGVMHEVGMVQTIAPQGVTLPEKTLLNTSVHIVSPEYFETLGIPLLVGRVLEERDRDVKPEPIVVNKAFGDLFFPRENPIGKGLIGSSNGNSKPSMGIVGVVGTAKYRSLREENPPISYGLENERFSGKTLYVRTF